MIKFTNPTMKSDYLTQSIVLDNKVIGYTVEYNNNVQYFDLNLKHTTLKNLTK